MDHQLGCDKKPGSEIMAKNYPTQLVGHISEALTVGHGFKPESS